MASGELTPLTTGTRFTFGAACDAASAPPAIAQASATPRTVDAHIKSLRRKLGESRDCIRTVRGVGYRYEAFAAL